MNDGFDLEKSFREFIKEKNVTGYDTCINSFKNFLVNKNMMNDDTAKIYFQGIRSGELIKGLEYYIDNNYVTSYTAASKYASCIKEYFLGIVQKEYIKNDELMSEFAFKTEENKSYRYKVNTFLDKKPEITESAGFETFEDVQDLIQACDLRMDNEKYISKALSSQMYFNKYRSALIIKLIILTGAAYRTLIDIKKSDLDLRHCIITINGFTVHLPNNLIDQLRKYIELHQKLIDKSNKDTDQLFIEFDGSTIREQNSITINFLKGLTGRSDLNGIIKYTIINMIKKGINQSIILKFTGVGDTIYNNCQDIVNNTMDLKSSRYLDSKIRSIETFDLL